MPLKRRIEEYVLNDGTRSQSRSKAIVVSPQAVIDAINKVGTKIDLKYYVSTAQHETNFCVNEWDTEVSGFQSVGIFQIGEEEAFTNGKYKLEDMLNLAKTAACMVKMSEAHLKRIIQVTETVNKQKKMPIIDEDYRAYLGICHNHGIGFCLGSIRNFGMDWKAYQKRNPNDNIVKHKYGADMITGGPYYPKPTTPTKPTSKCNCGEH